MRDPTVAQPLAGLDLQVPLRPAQERLVVVASTPAAVATQRLHLSAPPGTGKTLVGLELARRLGERTLVLGPTTTIVEQWRDTVRLLLADGGRLDDWVSTDPGDLRSITALTYQSLAVTERGAGELESVAERAWLAELAGDGITDPAGWLAGRRRSDPDAVSAELRRRARRLRRRMVHEGTADVHDHLHPNARALVERLVDHGVRTVVLDECHHLLDHWALVLCDLFERIEASPGADLHVIGLTATLPDPSTPRAEELYTRLLGDVDIEIPTPVVVAEGALAPYRDLVRFVTPSTDEQALLDDLGGAFDGLMAEVTTSEVFTTWLVRQPIEAGVTTRMAEADADAAEADRDAWGRWLRDRPISAGAILRAHRHLGLALPSGLDIPADADEPFGMDDRLQVLEDLAVDLLMVSDDPEHRRLLDVMTQVLGGFGLSLTTRGLRHGRSPVDLVVERSEAKARAAAEVLAAEHAHLGDRLRALVVTDLDRVATPVARLRGVLEDDAGSARRLHRVLATAEGARRLDPVLVTASTVRAGNVIADDLAFHLDGWFADRGLDARCRAEPVGRDVQELVGSGSDWSTRHIVPGVTAAFAEGLTRCIVGTRGLFGQGWDAPSCNTLVDLTAVTTATATRQLQGRILRRDPDWPEKVAHRWDVVCVADGVAGGHADLDRFRRRHDRLWGLAVRDDEVAVVPGVAHVDADLADALADGVTSADLDAASARSIAAVDDRGGVAAAWARVEVTPHSEVRTVVRVRPPRHDPSAQVRITVGAGPARSPALLAAAAGVAGVAVVGGIVSALPVVSAAGAVGAVVVGLADAWRRRSQAGRALAGVAAAAGAVSPGALDRLLVASGRAVVDALVTADVLPGIARAAGVAIHRRGDEAVVSVTDPPAGDLLPAHHRAIARSVTELLGPVRSPRYLLEVRIGSRQVWLAAPDALGGRRRDADALAGALAAALHADVRAVWAHTDEGRDALVAAWAQRRPPLQLSPDDRWV